ncbi:MAG: flagellar biosynthesis anti-sigma factor FlgM [Terracidiphilus sp.]|nr:flagellar biosynthesis anti-sigma factor FlgM [Terracidiphilus sp.]
MNVRNDVEGLNTLLGIQSQPVSSTAGSRAGQSTSGSQPLSTDEATVSSAGSNVSQAASASDVRLDKVEAVKSAIASGTYNVPASAVAGKVVDALLTSSVSSK